MTVENINPWTGQVEYRYPYFSAEQVEAYAAAGMLSIASAPVKQFACPVIPVGGR